MTDKETDAVVWETIKRAKGFRWNMLTDQEGFAYITVDAVRQFYKKTDEGYVAVEESEVPERFSRAIKTSLGMTGLG